MTGPLVLTLGGTRLPRLAPVFALSILIATVGCGDAGSPTAPEPEPALNISSVPALSFRQLSTGDGHACGVTTDSLAYCWGGNHSGQLGDGTTTSRLAPVAVKGGLRFRSVKAGENHSCGIAGNGRAFCWGSNGLGQLGDGTTGTASRLTPTAVQGGLSFRNVTAGDFYTCGVTTEDKAYCWGTGSRGQLGDGTVSDLPRRSPTPVAGGIRFQSVSAGSRHTCGLSTVKRAYCWGYNDLGQLGDSTEINGRGAPVRVAGGRWYKSLDAGQFHTCAVTIESEAFCWGNGRDGQFGNGRAYLSFWPRKVAGGLLFRNVGAGGSHSCGVSTNGRTYCWGFNSDGQLGDGTTTQRLTPALVVGGLQFASLSGGEFFSCGLTAGSQTYCWGSNQVGQLGDGTGTGRLRPVAVSGTT